MINRQYTYLTAIEHGLLNKGANLYLCYYTVQNFGSRKLAYLTNPPTFVIMLFRCVKQQICQCYFLPKCFGQCVLMHLLSIHGSFYIP